jgi:hypothetical protein
VPRLAAGRARALGVPTRGTTNPNRLRRVDRWITHHLAGLLRAAKDPLVIDLGFGSSPITTVELADRLRPIRPGIRVLGLELDPERVAAAKPATRPGELEFARGGFELAGRAPILVRAFNVLRQYPEPEVASAWATLRARLAPGGVLVEGTCDEIGRRNSWIAMTAHAPRTFSLSCKPSDIDRPSDLAERLPKALIHRNVPGERVHTLLGALDDCWDTCARFASFGPRVRWAESVRLLAARGWPVHGRPARWRLGELTLPWDSVAPATAPQADQSR